MVSGNWTLLGRGHDLRGRIDWHKDPHSDYQWPRTFYADLPLYNLPGDVDVKYIWEVGRLQFLVELARGWLFQPSALAAGLAPQNGMGNFERRPMPTHPTLARSAQHEDRFAVQARSQVLDWIDQNPKYEGVQWTSSLEVAMRAISCIWLTATLHDWDGWRKNDGQVSDHARLAASLVDHADYLQRHFSFYSSPYNHLIGEAAGLYLIGCALDRHGEAARWRQRGGEVLLEHGPRQFYQDGFSIEQATGYQFYTLGFLTMALLAARRRSEPLADLEPHVHRAYRAAAAFRQPDGRWPVIGDVDSARSIPVHHEDFLDFNSLCSLGAVLFDDPELITSDEPGAELYWLCGCEGVKRWRSLRRKRKEQTGRGRRFHILDESGYAIARHDGDWLLFDAGPIAGGLHHDATPSAAHGHADMLQVLYATQGRSVLQDSGMPFYGGCGRWVDYFRGPAAHNTIEVENAPVARQAGLLAWSHVVAKPQLATNFSEKVWLAKGSVNLKPGVLVERYLFCLPNKGLWIADWIETDQPREVRWYWQLPEKSVVKVERPAAKTQFLTGPVGGDQEGSQIHFATWSESAPVDLTVSTPSDLTLSVASNQAPLAWHAPGYGLRQPAQRIRQRAIVGDRLLVVHFVGASPTPVQVLIHGRHVNCRLHQPGEEMFVETAARFEAEAIWRVVACDPKGQVACDPKGQEETQIFLAGATNAAGTPLRGVGGWPAAMVSARLHNGPDVRSQATRHLLIRAQTRPR